MGKFEVNEIVWARHPRRNMLWPAQVVEKAAGGKQSWQVSFFSAEAQKELATVPENSCKPFSEEGVAEKDAPLDLYDAYILARKEHTRLKTQHKDSSEDLTLDPVLWTTNDLRDFLNGLMGGVRENGKLAWKGGAVPFQPCEEECSVYLREGFCQKLNYLLKQCALESELLTSLAAIREKMKAMLAQAFLLGNL